MLCHHQGIELGVSQCEVGIGIDTMVLRPSGWKLPKPLVTEDVGVLCKVILRVGQHHHARLHCNLCLAKPLRVFSPFPVCMCVKTDNEMDSY